MRGAYLSIVVFVVFIVIVIVVEKQLASLYEREHLQLAN